ncbi:MAG TPA: alpha/beta hydrolase [Burkholderiales bacterium]|jgi:pimeloyl-ACP methyl ester carboxylesterase|nr:alpha/beta hydrolase [Burkholderiales bacterium]
MPTLKIRDVNIHYRVLGTGGPWLALITGGRRGFNEFVPLAEKIAAHGVRVLLHDRRNTGASDILIDGKDGEEEIWTDDLYELLGRLEARPAVVGGASSGARTSILTYLRHPDAVRALFLMRLTGGEFAAGRLPEMYYGQFIKAAREGGMAAVCATEQYQERIAANPANRERLMCMDPKRYVEVMSSWLAIFTRGPVAPMYGVTDAQLASIRVPSIVIPGNDKTHSMPCGRAIQRLIPGSRLVELQLEDQDRPLVPFPEWAPHEETIARVCADFVKSNSK